jgi:hypothetical protein
LTVINVKKTSYLLGDWWCRMHKFEVVLCKFFSRVCGFYYVGRLRDNQSGTGIMHFRLTWAGLLNLFSSVTPWPGPFARKSHKIDLILPIVVQGEMMKGFQSNAVFLPPSALRSLVNSPVTGWLMMDERNSESFPN